jgi:hypothetical protein
MHAWIYAVLNHLPGIIKSAGKWILDRIWGVFDDSLRFARWIKTGIQTLNGTGKNFIRAIRDMLTEAAATVRWIIVTEIPRRAKKAFDDAIKWSKNLIDWVYSTLRNWIATLERWTKQAIANLRDFAEKAIRWIFDQINDLWQNVKKLVDRVFGTWATPTRLAEWAIGAIWSVALRYAYSNRDRITRWFLQSSAAFTQWAVRMIEQVLVRLL